MPTLMNRVESILHHLDIQKHEQSLIHAIKTDQDFWLTTDAELEYGEHELHWESEERDFHVLNEIGEIIDADLSDEAFNRAAIPYIQDKLRESWLFHQLAIGPGSKSSQAGRENPFSHTISVLKLCKTDHLGSPLLKRAVRWLAILHDVGKFFGADGFESRFHALLSAEMVARYLLRYQRQTFGEEFIQKMLFVIRYHHTLYELARTFITKEAALERWSDPVIALLFYELGIPDVLSVSENRQFAKALNDMLFETHPQLYRFSLRRAA